MTLKVFLKQKGQEYAPFDPHRILKLYEQFKRDFLQDFKPKVIHIVGTNGKGSTGRFIALSLERTFNVVHFTSPHLFEFNERFFVNGRNLSFEVLEEAHQILSQKPYLLEASYFEYATFLVLFLSREMDFLVLEAGLGGEFDSTNVLRDKISVFTQIGLDHTEILGDSIEQIARTKLNSMGRIAFLGIQSYPQILSIAQEIATQKFCTLFTLDSYESNPKVPKFLAQNYALAKRVIEYLGGKICKINELNLAGRMQKIAKNVWVDVGHNVDSALALAEEFGGQKIVLVYNSYAQKEIPAILKALKGVVKRVEILPIDHQRIVPQNRLEEILKSLNISFTEFKGFNRSENYLVFGSFSVVAEIFGGKFER